VEIFPWQGANLINIRLKAIDFDPPPEPVFRIRIHRIHMFLGLLNPLVRGMDPDPDPALDPDPSIIKQESKKNLDSYCFLTSIGLFMFVK
jgi:hypothetical protein